MAGVGRMTFGRFVGFSVGGGLLWVTLMTAGRVLLRQHPLGQDHFEVVVLAIVFISVLPVAVHALRTRRGTAAVEAVPVTESVNP